LKKFIKSKIHKMLEHSALEQLIQKRRTPNPALFLDKPIDVELLKQAIDIARYAPNHKRTEPARFYLANNAQKTQIGGLLHHYILKYKGADKEELAAKKQQMWANIPALLVVTNYSSKETKLAVKNAELQKEDYATVSTIIQNLTLLLLNQGLHVMWSTAGVKNEPAVAEVFGFNNFPEDEQIAGFLLIGYLPDNLDLGIRTLKPLDGILRS